MDSKSRVHCIQCLHWSRLENNPSQGECRRYAPRPMVVESLHMMAFWPVTNEQGWCGEIQPAEADQL